MSYLRLGLGVGFLLALISAFFYGQHLGTQRCEAAHLKAEKVAADKRDKQIVEVQAQDAKAAEADVHRETVVREITREVPKIIDRPVYRNVCVDADGVRLLDRAVDAANGGGTPGGRSAGAAGDVQPSTRNGKSADR